MWQTADGLRVLRGQEAELIRCAVKQMLTCLLDEREQSLPARHYGITWFDQWETEQRIWLLEHVACALLLEDHPPPSPAAMFEATIDAMFCHVVSAIEEDIGTTYHREDEYDWKQGMIASFQAQTGKLPQIDLGETDIRQWYALASQIADAILGHSSYQQAERFRDGDARTMKRFLEQRALPADFLQRLPPLPSEAETRASLTAIGMLVNR